MYSVSIESMFIKVPIITAVVSIIQMASICAQKVTFRNHIEPIFSQSCNNCHNPDKMKGDLDLTTYAGEVAIH